MHLPSSPGRSRIAVVRALAVLVVLVVVMVPMAVPDAAASTSVVDSARVPMSDGVDLEVRYGGRAGPDGVVPARPTIVEFTPYAPTCCPETFGPAYNEVKVHVRGTGTSAGRFDALGPRSQADVVEVLDWVCTQDWSDGRVGLVGFSASAIMVYNSLHQPLPCVEAAVLGSGTHELYRDLLYPGGIPNMGPAVGVFALIGGPMVGVGGERLAEDPTSVGDAALGMAQLAVEYERHPVLDEFWRERGFRGDANDLPVLMYDGFFDVESRGAFQAFQELRDDGAHLRVTGAHDGVPEGSGGSEADQQAWFDQHLRGVETGILDEPRVQLLLADGDREDMLAGDYVRLDGADWPLPGTTWTTLHLDATRSGTSTTLNDGTLSIAPGDDVVQPYPTVTSLGTATDPYTTSILGVNDGATLTDMGLAEPVGLAFTTEPLEQDVHVVGPVGLELVLTSAVPETDLFAVVSDVWPDGSAHPMAMGRLRSSFSEVDPARSLVDAGRIVQPYARFDAKSPVTPGEEHRYHLELWPIGNRFEAGHRVRLHLVGASTYHQPTTPALNTVRLGAEGSRLHLPVAPGEDLEAALGAPWVEQQDQGPVDPRPTSEGAGAPAEPGRATSLPATGGGAGAAALVMAMMLAAHGRRR